MVQLWFWLNRTAKNSANNGPKPHRTALRTPLMSAYQYIYIYIYVHKRKTKKNATIVATVPFGTVATVQNLNKRVIKKKKKRLTKLLLQLQCCTVKYVGCTVSKHCSGIVKNTNERLKKCNYCSYSAAWHCSYCAKLKQKGY